MSIGLWYLSFAGDDGFHGGIFVNAVDLIDAVAQTNRLGINPGGEVLGFPVPHNMPHPSQKLVEKLLTKDQIDTVWSDCKSLGDFEAEACQ